MAPWRQIKQHFLRQVDFYRSEYDLIVFDTNPNATFLTRCALEAADRVLAPMHTDIYSLRGVKLLNQVINAHADPGGDTPGSFRAVQCGQPLRTVHVRGRCPQWRVSMRKPGSRCRQRLLKSALPAFKAPQVKPPQEGQPPGSSWSSIPAAAAD
jgi:chromosome partitioning protein